MLFKIESRDYISGLPLIPTGRFVEMKLAILKTGSHSPVKL
jgi:hypothetical protein